MDEHTPRILTLIPAYNEAERISAVIAGARAHGPVLVVDDGSHDDTAARAEAAGADVLRQAPNQGKGAALRAGFRWALEAGYDAVITLDADGQHDPDEIPDFIAAYAGGQPDLVIGARDFGQMPPVRRVSNTLGRVLFSWALGQPVRDNQSGYRLISRRLMQAMLDSAEAGFEFEVEMIVIAVQQGYGLAWVPIRTIYAGESSHIRPWQHLTNFLRVVWRTRRALHHPVLPLHWLPLLLLPLIGVLGALLLVLNTGGDDGSGDANAYPSPPPVRVTPVPTVPDRIAGLPPQAYEIGEPVPAATLSLLDGGTVALDELAGEVVFLNIWATWCEPCQEEMPALQALHEAGAAHVIALTDPTLAQDETEIRTFVDDLALSLPVALSTDAALYRQLYAGLPFDGVIPVTFIIDRAGVIRYAHPSVLHPDDIDAYLTAVEG
jgi:peroxiredoxin